MGELAILSSNGDDKLMWDINNKDEVEKAHKEFDKFKDKDYTFFEVLRNGDQGKEIKKFDPKVESIICIPTTRKG